MAIHHNIVFVLCKCSIFYYAIILLMKSFLPQCRPHLQAIRDSFLYLVPAWLCVVMLVYYFIHFLQQSHIVLINRNNVTLQVLCIAVIILSITIDCPGYFSEVDSDFKAIHTLHLGRMLLSCTLSVHHFLLH